MSYAYYLKHGTGKMSSAAYPKRLEVLADIHGPSKTRQEFTEECDINNIMKRYEASGVWPFRDEAEPIYYDFVGMKDLQGAMNHMIEADEAFMRLPALVRKEFDNDPVRFVEYATDGNNIGKLREWGLAAPETIPEPPMRVQVVKDQEAPPIAPASS